MIERSSHGIPEEAWRLAAGDFGNEMGKLIRSYAMPLFWAVGVATGGLDDKLVNGTTFFLDCGQGPFGVTAGHVYDEFVEHAAQGARCQIGFGRPNGRRLFDLRDRLIARGKHVDVATYRISMEEIEGTGAIILGGSQSSWPPAAPKEGDALLFAGYPGIERKIETPGTVTLGIYCGGGRIDSISDRDISCLIPHEFMVKLRGFDLPPPGYRTAGMSGAPVLLVERGDVLAWRLAGVVYTGSWQLVDMIKAARADLICADGRLFE